MTQKEIDWPGGYFPVKDLTLPTAKKLVMRGGNDVRWFFHNRGMYCVIDGDRSECIPGAEIIRVLRKEAHKKGIRFGYLTTVADPPDKPRWAKVAGTVVTLLVAVIITIGLILNWVRT